MGQRDGLERWGGRPRQAQEAACAKAQRMGERRFQEEAFRSQQSVRAASTAGAGGTPAAAGRKGWRGAGQKEPRGGAWRASRRALKAGLHGAQRRGGRARPWLNSRCTMAQCRDLENHHHEKLLEIAISTREKIIKGELDEDLPDAVRLVSAGAGAGAGPGPGPGGGAARATGRRSPAPQPP